MKYVWPVLLGLVRSAYLSYSLWCRLFPLALLALAVALLLVDLGQQPWLGRVAWVALGVYLLLAAYAVLFVYGERDPQDPNPGQSAFLSWFGTLKRFRNVGGAAAVKLHWPSSYLVENPRGYRISGAQTRAVLDLLREGDILLRGYEGYVDGEFIRRSSVTSGHGFQPGWFTHAALYVGALTKADRTHVPDAFRDNAAYFSSGPQMVIHSMAKGVHAEDILSFLRCDYLAVLRLPPELSLPPGQTADLRSPRALTKPPAPSDPTGGTTAIAVAVRRQRAERAGDRGSASVGAGKKSARLTILIAATPPNSTASVAPNWCITACAAYLERLNCGPCHMHCTPWCRSTIRSRCLNASPSRLTTSTTCSTLAH
jgi:hypothetical protein